MKELFTKAKAALILMLLMGASYQVQAQESCRTVTAQGEFTATLKKPLEFGVSNDRTSYGVWSHSGSYYGINNGQFSRVLFSFTTHKQGIETFERMTMEAGTELHFSSPVTTGSNFRNDKASSYTVTMLKNGRHFSFKCIPASCEEYLNSLFQTVCELKKEPVF